MKLKNSILGIGVASYNEVDALAVSVKSLVQCKKYFASVGINLQIQISDNYSDQERITKIKKLCLQNQIIFSSNIRNMGFGANLFKLLKNSHSKYILIIGCGEVVDPYNLEKLNRILTYHDLNNVFFKFGMVLGDRKSISTDFGENFEISKILRVNPAISLNIWNAKLIDHKLRPANISNDWAHIELAATIDSMHPELNSFVFHESLVRLYQPTEGWYTSKDFLTIILRFDSLIEKFPNISLGPRIGNNVVVICWWIYNYRLVSDERMSLKMVLPLLIRVRSHPKAVLQFILISQTPFRFIRFVIKIRTGFFIHNTRKSYFRFRD